MGLNWKQKQVIESDMNKNDFIFDDYKFGRLQQLTKQMNQQMKTWKILMRRLQMMGHSEVTNMSTITLNW